MLLGRHWGQFAALDSHETPAKEVIDSPPWIRRRKYSALADPTGRGEESHRERRRYEAKNLP